MGSHVVAQWFLLNFEPCNWIVENVMSANLDIILCIEENCTLHMRNPFAHKPIFQLD